MLNSMICKSWISIWYLQVFCLQRSAFPPRISGLVQWWPPQGSENTWDTATAQNPAHTNSSKCLLLRVSIISNTEVTWHNWDRNISYSIFCSCTDEKTTVCKAGPRTQISLVPVLYFYSNTILSADRSSTYRLEAGDTLILTIILNHSNLQFEI